MLCPKCGTPDSKVVDSRQTEDGRTIRRRRECQHCKYRFTTYERIEETPLVVVKKDGTTQEFNREKILRGIIRAAEKRPVGVDVMNDIVERIEHHIMNTMEKEIATEKIGEMVMDALKEVDEVSYVRFASVYRSFKDSKTFLEELTKLMNGER